MTFFNYPLRQVLVHRRNKDVFVLLPVPERHDDEYLLVFNLGADIRSVEARVHHRDGHRRRRRRVGGTRTRSSVG